MGRATLWQMRLEATGVAIVAEKSLVAGHFDYRFRHATRQDATRPSVPYRSAEPTGTKADRDTTPDRDEDYPSAAATSERSLMSGLSRWNPSSRHGVENNTSITPSDRVSTSADTCLFMNSASSGSTIRAT